MFFISVLFSSKILEYSPTITLAYVAVAAAALSLSPHLPSPPPLTHTSDPRSNTYNVPLHIHAFNRIRYITLHTIKDTN
jgi:hypothetical protein